MVSEANNENLDFIKIKIIHKKSNGIIYILIDNRYIDMYNVLRIENIRNVNITLFLTNNGKLLFIFYPKPYILLIRSRHESKRQKKN